MTPPQPPFARNLGHYLSNLVIVGLIRAALCLPYETRVRGFGWITEKIIGPLAGYQKRARTHLNLIWPELPNAKRNRIAANSLNNIGRSFIENYSAEDFPKRQAETVLTGPGFLALEKAATENRPVILVTGHFGNYEATRTALVAQGFNVGGLYRDMSNPYFNAHYVKTMQRYGGPVFAKGRKGTAGFVKHLKQGGQLVLLFDQHVYEGETLTFLGREAKTATSAAELAVRYNGLLIPFYGKRRANGLDFDCIIEAPIEGTDPLKMTQALNDSLANQISQSPEQWFWIHRRWRT